LLGPALTKLPASHAAYLTGHTFFPSLISASFAHGLAIAFDFAIAACLIAAAASLLRGKRYVHELHGADAPAQPSVARETSQPGAPRVAAGTGAGVPSAPWVASVTPGPAAHRHQP